MTRRLLFVLLRSIAVGWLALGLFALLSRVLMGWVGPVVGGQWIATVELGLDCAMLAATGWVTGRSARPQPLLAVLAFGASLTFWDLRFLLAINVPWLARLMVHVLSGESAYVDSLITTAVSHVLLFGSLIAGGLLSRPSTKPMSIAV